ncbi:related to UTP10 - nucleolar protein, component of the small subunit processome [Pseudozyma flocculosa]|uniref:U3 small nucleolar RNA-associated protein 10 n=1 Tax=Pseudozyma flocculosa TaxID=84751 RepID=A0A5C3F913_9BASI|nr:related to UTP10 - nucleolar protein, component of the small subunit processome [Pseudozyma flocculosa]
MASSLAAQLANVRSYNADRLSASSAIASKVSYLFPPKTAVQQDLFTLHALATSGWNELCSQDAAFASWRSANLLFGEESRQRDRLMLDQQENNDIDAAVGHFLQLAGPVLLSKAASKCIEWLVRRFRVHEFSVDDLLAAFLPYHQTPQFARILSISKIDGKPHLQFLLAVKKSNAPLPASALQAALLAPHQTTASLDLLRWVAGLVHPSDRAPAASSSSSSSSSKLASAAAASAAQPHRILVSFWTSTLVQMCARWAGQQQSGQLGAGGLSRSTANKKKSARAKQADAQSILTVLLPAAVQVASSAQLGLDAQVGGYMLLCSIAAAFPLSRQAVQGIFGSLAKGLHSARGDRQPHPTLTRAMLAASYALCASPDDVEDPLTLRSQAADRLVPDSIARALVASSSSDLLATLKKSSLAYDVEPFLTHLLSALVVRLADEPSSELLEQLLALQTTSDAIVAKVLAILLELPLASTANGGGGGADDDDDDAAAGLAFVRHLHEELLPAARTHRVKVLAALRQRRPAVFDAAVKTSTADESHGSKRLTAVWQVVQSVMSVEAGTSPEDAANGQTGAGDASDTNVLWLAIHSADAGQRNLALGQLLDDVAAGKVSATDTMVRDALQSRIQDSSDEVLETLYSKPQSLLDAVDGTTLLEAIVQALDNGNGSGDLAHHLRFLLAHFLGAHPELAGQVIQNAVWPRLLWTSAGRTAAQTAVKVIAEVALDDSTLAGALLAGAARAGRSAASIEPAEANELVVAQLASQIVAIQDEKQRQTWINFLFAQASVATGPDVDAVAALRRRPSQLLASLVLIRILSLVDENRFQRLASRAVTHIANPVLAVPEAGGGSSKTKKTGDEAEASDAAAATPASSSAAASRGSVSADLHAAVYRATLAPQTMRKLAGELLQQVVLGLRVPKLSAILVGPPPAVAVAVAAAAAGGKPAKDTTAVGLLSSLYATANTPSTGAALSKLLLQTLFVRLRDSVLPFLANVWTHASTASVTVRLAALRHASAYLQAFAAEGMARDFQVIVPALLIALADTEASIRMAALACLEDVLAIASASSPSSTKKQVEVFGYDAIYGEGASKDLQYLDAASLVRYLGELLARKTAYRNDAHFLPQLHRDLLNVHRQDGRKDVNYKNSILCFLCSHVACWPDAALRLALLETLQGVSDASKLTTLLPLVRALVRNQRGATAGLVDTAVASAASARRRYAELLFGCYDKSCRSVLEDASNGSWALFLDALAGGSDGSDVQTPAVLALQRGGLFAAIDAPKRQEAYQHLAALVADPARPATPEAQACLRDLDVDAAILVSVLAELRDTLTAKALEAPEAKRARTSLGADETVRRAAAVLVVLLEAASGKRLARSAALVSELFEVLRVAVELHASLAVNAEYLLQLAMSCLANLVAGLDADSAPADIVQSLRADTIVGAIKASHNPQTFQHALLLLSRVATIAPEPVLHNVMPIFTFVGSTVLQRDDAFSYTVVEKTLKSIVPALVASLKRRQAAVGGADIDVDVEAGAGDAEAQAQRHFALLRDARGFVRVFTDAAHYVPKHRRQVFFKLLVEILGADDFGAAVCMLLVDRSAFKIAKQPRQDVEQTMQLPLAVIQAQPVLVQLQALNQIWREVARIWTHRLEADPEALGEHVFLDRAGRTDKEHIDRHAEPIRQIQALVLFVRQVLDSRVFSAQSASLSGAEAARAAGVRFEDFVRSAVAAADPHSLDNAAINSVAREALHAAMPYVPIVNVMNVVALLIKAGDGQEGTAAAVAASRASGFALLASRMAALGADSDDRKAVSAYTSDVVAAALDVLRTAGVSDALRQAALDAIKAISASALVSEHGALASTLPDLVSVGRSTDGVPAPARITVFSITRRLADRLGPRLIPHLAKLVPFCLSTVAASVSAAAAASADAADTDTGSAAATSISTGSGQAASLRTGALDTLTGLFGSVPTFMTGYVSDIVRASISPELKEAMASQSGSSTASERSLNALLSALIKRTPAQSLFDAVFKIWEQTLAGDGDATTKSVRLVALFDFLSRALRQTDRAAVSQTYKSVFRFMLRAFDLRRLQKAVRAGAGGVDDAAAAAAADVDVGAIEEHAIQALLRMVLKLNESSFRPLFLRLFDWAVLDLVDDDTAPGDAALLARQVVLYKTFNALSDQLRGLVSGYYSVLLDHSVEMLQHFGRGRIGGGAGGRPRGEGDDARALWTALVLSVQKSARYDEGSFWTASRAQKVIPALLSQASLVDGPSAGSGRKRGGGGGGGATGAASTSLTLQLPLDTVSSMLVKTTVAVAHAVPVEAVLKTLNGALLSQSSSRSSLGVRTVALRVLTAVWTREGEAMLGLVPETVAQVSELLDDDERAIAHEAGAFRRAIEAALGESLDAYLT